MRRRLVAVVVGLLVTSSLGSLAALGTLGAPHTAAPATAASPEARQVLERVEHYLAERKAALDVPGLSYAVVHRDRLVRAGGIGVDGAGRPMTPRTPLGVGSVSKPVTSTAVLRLVEAGAVELDAPVRRYLPWFTLADETVARQITIRHLLHQTSGLSSAAGYARADRGDNAPGGVTRWVRDLADVTPTGRPGRRHQYSPANAMVLAAVVEAVSGRSFGDYLRREVLSPLEMPEAIVDAEEARALPPGHQYYFGVVRIADAPFDTSGVPYGYLAASAEDLAHFAMVQVDHGRYAGRQFLRPETIGAMHHGGPEAAGGRYGFGWRVGKPAGFDQQLVWHAGASEGYHAIVLTAPASGWAVVVLQNQWSPFREAEANAAGFGAMRILLGKAPDPPAPGWTYPGMLVGLGVGVLLLGTTGAISTARLIRRRPARSWIRHGAVAVVGLAVAGAASSGLPYASGVQLRQILAWVPDVGHLLVALTGLGLALALATLARPLLPPRLQ